VVTAVISLCPLANRLAGGTTPGDFPLGWKPCRDSRRPLHLYYKLYIGLPSIGDDRSQKKAGGYS